MSDWVPDIPRLQAREDEEWLKVERTFAGRLLAYAHRRVGDRQAAEDVVQDTLLGAVRGIGDFDPVFTFEQYLFGICKNRTIDHLRRRGEKGSDGCASTSAEATADKSRGTKHTKTRRHEVLEVPHEKSRLCAAIRRRPEATTVALPETHIAFLCVSVPLFLCGEGF